jgi:hypothetical protein
MKRILIILLALTVAAQAGLFDDRLPSARATGMSGSFVAIANDVWAGYYNPAGLAKLEQYQVGSSYQVPYNAPFFMNYFVSFTAPLSPHFGSVGLSFQDFGVKYNGNELSAEYTMALSHGFFLLKDVHSSLSAGYNLKAYHWKLGESVDGLNLGSATTFGIDVGFQATLYGRTHLGVYVLNLNAPSIGEYTKHDLPQRIVVGAAYQPYSDLTTSISMNKTVGMDTQIEGGLEFRLLDMVNLRFGAGTDPNRFSAGLGIDYAGIQFDYALRTHPVLAETHQFGISYHFSE